MSNNQVVRIPSLPIGKMVDENGNPTQQEQSFRVGLINSLQQNFGPEGMVAPAQAYADIQTIAANQSINALTGQTAGGPFTTQGGTFWFDTTNNRIVVALLSAGVPTLYSVNLTAL